MRSHLVPGIALLAGLGVGGNPASAQQHDAAAPNIARPNMVLQQVVEGLPTDDKQTVRVMTATFKPGDKTVYHTHRFPVTVYVLKAPSRSNSTAARRSRSRPAKPWSSRRRWR